MFMNAAFRPMVVLAVHSVVFNPRCQNVLVARSRCISSTPACMTAFKMLSSQKLDPLVELDASAN